MSENSSILLHACCGPCSITPLQELLDIGWTPTLFFFNPNIHPLTEYLRRREGVLRVAQRFGVDVSFPEEEYRPAGFFQAVAFHEDDRCGRCYLLRLEATAGAAAAQGYAAFSTTLLYSRYQQHDRIRETGMSCNRPGLHFYYRDFRGGWSEGMRLSREWSIYRQPYCGCVFSEAERYAPRLARARREGMGCEERS